MKVKATNPPKKSSSTKTLHCVQKVTQSDVIADHINRSCDQMAVLLASINDIEVCLFKASQVHTRCLLGIRLQILQNVYDKFYLYTAHKAQQLAKV